LRVFAFCLHRVSSNRENQTAVVHDPFFSFSSLKKELSMSDAVNMTVRGGAVRVTMAAKVAGDLGALQKGLKSLAERLGHPACATGCDILHLGMEREFSLGGPGDQVALNPQPLPPREFALAGAPGAGASQPVTVSIPDSVSRDINALTRATAVVLGKLGCPQCCSGFDILFRRELDMFAVDEKLNVQGFGKLR